MTRSRPAVVAVGIVLLCVVAWSASRADVNVDARPRSVGSPVGEGVRNDVALVITGAVGMVVVLAIIPLLLSRRDRGPFRRDAGDRRVNWRQVMLTLLLGFAAVYALLLFARGRSDDLPEPPPEPPPEELDPLEPVDGEGATGWSAVALLASGALVVLIGTIVLYRHGRNRRLSPDEVGFPQITEVDPIDLDRLPPPAAVRAAYADALRQLRLIGSGPLRAETPYEHLERTRDQLPTVRSALALLIKHDEIARFSHHPVSEEMKAESIEAHQQLTSIVEKRAGVLT